MNRNIASQWSADFTEHAHITLVKDPARAGNNQMNEAQICRYLDRLETIRDFNLMTALLASGVRLEAGDSDNTHSEKSDSDTDSDEEHAQVSTTEELLSLLSNFGYKPDSPRTNTDYFYCTKCQPFLNPPRTFHCTDNIVCHLS